MGIRGEGRTMGDEGNHGRCRCWLLVEPSCVLLFMNSRYTMDEKNWSLRTSNILFLVFL